MSWKKHFTVYQFGNTKKVGQSHTSASKFGSWLPEVYTGQPNRIERYVQYDQMDIDSEVNAALDTIAEFSTQFADKTNIPFEVEWKEDSTETEVALLEKALEQWNNLNDWDKRIWRIFRNTCKYGDQFFIRDPETYEWNWCNPMDVTKVIINEAKGKEPEQYIIRNLALNLQEKTASNIIPHSDQFASVTAMQRGGIIDRGAYGTGSGHSQSGYGGGEQEEYGVDANHIVHLGMTEGMDINWPFGQSILDPVFKTYKQKELLEDSIIIYRVQRAPERRVFYIDVGNMPSHKAMGFVERVKNEIHQRRIPNKTGGGTTIMDASYNPLSIMEDYFFAQTAEGRGSKVEVLPGGENLGQIDDLRYFTNKILRALRVPSSYLPTGPDDGTSSYVDGRVGTAFIQEYRFTKYCQRIQALLGPTFDKEFKLFLKWKGINIDSGTFELRFTDPQSFSQYREVEVDQARSAVFSGLAEAPYMSKRFALKKYLGLTEDEIVENEQMWRQENGEQDTQLDPESDMSGLGAVGVQPMDPNMMQPMEAEPLPGEDPMAPGPGGVAGADGAASPITGNELPGAPGAVQ
ncbi:uncharacterized protein METZ01_LOCUS65304 [marine metagenome]|jgi:hypothetical protein|uniref:Portal protein n=1 Tax=marine metagenome TaxID=408172 RepID=A0A381T8F0_9ZZZZ